MAKVTHLGSAKPDDPSYLSGPVVGGKRIGRLPDSGKPVSSETPPKQAEENPPLASRSAASTPLSQQPSLTKRHPSRPPFLEGVPVLSGEKLEQLRKDLESTSTVSFRPLRSSKSSRRS